MTGTMVDQESIWGAVEEFSSCMMVTKDGDDLRARPMTPITRARDGVIYFIADRRGFNRFLSEVVPEDIFGIHPVHRGFAIGVGDADSTGQLGVPAQPRIGSLFSGYARPRHGRGTVAP